MKPVLIQRPQRWDNPFSADMSDADVGRILEIDLFRNVDAKNFPASTPLREIVRNDMCIRQFSRGDIIIRAGDYGTSSFIIMSGNVRVVLPPGLSNDLLGRAEMSKKGVWNALRQLWTNPRLPEVRDPTRYRRARGTGIRQLGSEETQIFLQDVPAILEANRTVQLGPGEMFGEIAALSREARTATIFADGDAVLVEVRRQGIRDISRRVDEFRQHVDQLYRERTLKTHLQKTPIFQHLSSDVIEKIAEKTLLATYGDFSWHRTYKQMREGSSGERLAQEPIIVEEGHYPDGLLMIRTGFGRVSRRLNHGHKTVRYIGHGAVFGFEEIAQQWQSGGDDVGGFRFSLRAVGYTDVLHVPTSIIEEHVLPTIPADILAPYLGADPDLIVAHDEDDGLPSTDGTDLQLDTSKIEFLVENRYINGTATMLIDLDRCVRCDACVEACAAGHNNNPRFIRHGRTFDHFMVANACMHCVDPVCMIGCPTGAIHRNTHGGQVIINDDTCIGCATCANNCPYDNIRMVEVRDSNGEYIREEATNSTIVKASKCDLCADQPHGPACQQACPHDALYRVNMDELPSITTLLGRQ
jgi:Fe-S-cluster-containing dehydrogenase component/CRP-like cAMP-binding protein